jgi:hypothetical protein
MGLWGDGPQTDEHLPQSPFTGQFLLMATFCLAFYDSYLSTEQCVADASCRAGSFLLNCILGGAFAEVNIYCSAEQIFSFSSAESTKNF